MAWIAQSPGTMTYGTNPAPWFAFTASTTAAVRWQPFSVTGTTTGNAYYICVLTGGTLDAEPRLPGWNCPLTAREEAAMTAEYRRGAEQYRQIRVRAQARAEELLLSLLDEEQAVSYVQQGSFELQGSAGGWWRIRRSGQAGNVDELERPGGDRIASWCCHPPDCLPDEDAHAAQYLQLVTAEEDFRATGNRTPRYRIPARAA